MTGDPPTPRMPRVADDALADALQEGIAATFTSFNTPLHMEKWYRDAAPIACGKNIACTMEIRHDAAPYGVLICTFSAQAISQILSVLGSADASDPAAMDDAAEEITNMIYGVTKSALNKNGCRFEAAIPATMDKLNPLPRRHGEKIVLPFMADGQACRVMVAFQKQK